MIAEPHFAVHYARPYDTGPAFTRDESREAQRWAFRANDSARASEDRPAFPKELQEIGRVSRYSFLEEEDCDLHRRRFLARVAITGMGT